MPRLPKPGSDNGTWGDILNTYLAVEHNSDGSQKPLPQSTIIDLEDDLAAKAESADLDTKAPLNSPTFIGTVTLPGDPTSSLQAATKDYVDSTTAAGAPDASTTTKGLVQLGGDLSGTATSPQIASGVIVNADINASAAIDQSKVANLTTDLSAKYTLPGSGIPKDDLSAAVQASLDNADAGDAVTSVDGQTGDVDLSGTYAKPATTGLLAARPAATVVGQRYLATDKALFESLDGSTWTQVAPDLADTANIPARPMTVIPVGDSLTARSTSTDGLSRSAVGHITWSQLLSHNRLTLVRNAGVSGEGTGEILARLNADVIAYAPGYCIYLAGINDLNPARAGGALTAAQIETNITAALDLLQAAGIFTFIMTVLPATFINTTTSKTNLAALNAWIRGLGATRKGLRVVDAYPKVASSANVYASGSLAWATGMDADGTHPSAKGAKVIGQELANAIITLVPRISPLSAAADPFELLPNPLMIGNSSGIATSVSSLHVSGTAPTFSKVARTDGVQGEWQQMVVAAGASSRVNQNATAGSFADGDSVVATIEVDEDASAFFTDTHGLTVQAINAAGNTILGSTTVNFVGTENIPTGSVLRTLPFTVPVGTAAGTLRVYWHATALAGGAVTVRIGRMSLRKVGT